MRAGLLRHLITIEQGTSTQTVGESVIVWTAIATAWARYEDIGGVEGPAGGQIQFGILRRRYEIRYLEALDPDTATNIPTKKRVKHNGRVWDIDLVSNVDARRREMHLACTARGV